MTTAAHATTGHATTGHATTGHAAAARTCDRATSVTRSLLGYGVIAGPVYIGVSLAQALTRDGFDLTRHAWSLLANGDLMEAIMKLGQEATAAGALLDTAGLAPSASGARVRLADGALSVTDGPFTESKELISYAPYDVRSKEEAVEWAARFMRLHRDLWAGWEGEAEVVKVLGLKTSPRRPEPFRRPLRQPFRQPFGLGPPRPGSLRIRAAVMIGPAGSFRLALPPEPSHLSPPT